MSASARDVFFLDFTSCPAPESVCGENGLRPVRLDCRDIRGTHGCCDADAARELRRRFRDVPADALHFFDSGNYHYLTFFFLEKIKVPFRLLVFDHHNDMREPAFPGLLSCGGWIRHALETLPLLRDVLLAGLGAEQFSELGGLLPAALRSRVHAWDEERFRAASFRQEFTEHLLSGGLPVYCSIDKDVFSPDVLTVDWDQGTLAPGELAACLDPVFSQIGLAGMDVCGGTGTIEPDPRAAGTDRLLLELFLRSGGEVRRE